MCVYPALCCPLVAHQAGATDFFAVWDGWLLDTLATWQKQVEKSYTISLEDERGTSPPPSLFTQQLAGITRTCHVADDTSEPLAPDDAEARVGVPPRKRARHEPLDLEVDHIKENEGQPPPLEFTDLTPPSSHRANGSALA